MTLLDVNIKQKNFRLNGSSINVLRDISFQVQAGEFISIIGPSGCGKSTILKILLGLDTDYEGSVLLNGNEVEEPGLDRGMVFQDHRLLPWLTVEENIAFALPKKSINSTRVEQTIELVGLSKFNKAFPSQLSGGMAQRVALARAIVNLPTVLILDEAFGSLDDFTRAKMQTELQRIVNESNTTTVMVSHNIDEVVLLSNRIYVLSDKPASIIDVIEVDMQKPRDKRSNDFIYYRNKLIMEL